MEQKLKTYPIEIAGEEQLWDVHAQCSIFFFQLLTYLIMLNKFVPHMTLVPLVTRQIGCFLVHVALVKYDLLVQGIV